MSMELEFNPPNLYTVQETKSDPETKLRLKMKEIAKECYDISIDAHYNGFVKDWPPIFVVDNRRFIPKLEIGRVDWYELPRKSKVWYTVSGAISFTAVVFFATSTAMAIIPSSGIFMLLSLAIMLAIIVTFVKKLNSRTFSEKTINPEREDVETMYTLYTQAKSYVEHYYSLVKEKKTYRKETIEALFDNMND